MADEKDPWAAWTPVAETSVSGGAASVPTAIASPNTGLALASAAKLTPAAAWELMKFGTSPTAAKTGGAIANAAATLGAAAHGIYSGNPSQVIAAPMEGWAAGKGGYFGTKALQGVARPVAVVLDKAAPIADAVAKVGGVQGALDLAQMAEPGRKDIGFLGMAPTDHSGTPSPEAVKQIGASVDAVKFLVAKGITPSEAMKQVTGGNPALIGPLMMAYMKAQQVK